MSRVSGLVVAGGHSTRLGIDKRRVRLGTITLLDRAVHLLASVSDDLLVAAPTSDPDSTAAVSGVGTFSGEVRIIPDALPERGPMAGILAGLRQAKQDRLLVIPVDMPMLTPPFLRFLVDVDPDAAATVPRGRAGLEPLVAVYHRSCAAELAERLERGAAAIHAFISSTGLPVRYVDEHEIRTYGDPARLFLNINTPEDLIRAAQLLAGPQPRRARP